MLAELNGAFSLLCVLVKPDRRTNIYPPESAIINRVLFTLSSLLKWDIKIHKAFTCNMYFFCVPSNVPMIYFGNLDDIFFVSVDIEIK